MPRGPHVHVLGTRTSLERTVRTANCGNAGDALASWGLVPQESEGEAPPTPAPPGGERGAELFFFPSPPRGAELGAEAQVVMPVMPGAPLHCHQGGSVPPGS